MKRTLISFLLLAIALIILLTACAAPTPAPTATPTPLPTATITPLPSATATITPTLVEPSMANLPVEWADRIDRIETMVEMDGKTTRVVAIQRSEDPTKDSKIRALQWDPDAGEWVKYHPQIGWVGWGDQDFGFGEGQHSTWIEDINLPERKTLANPLRYTDGTEIPLGYLGPLYYEKDRSENGTRAEFFQGYVLEVRLGEPLSNSSSNSRMLFLYTGIPLESGDWIVFVSSAIDQDTEVSKAWSLERLTNGDFGKMDAGLMETPSESITYSRLREYLLTHQEELVGQPTIQGIGIDPGGNYPEKEDELRFYDALKRGEPVDAGGTYPVFSSPGFVSEAWWNQVVDWSENR